MTKKIIVETSARHIHLSDADLETLFGKGYQLTNKKNLSQPGQFACEEKVTVVGAKGEQKMSVLGPTRKATQVELSLTDARALGLQAAIRESGDIEGTAGCKLVGPAGEVESSLIFGDVVCRVSENYATAMHIDTDESNAAGCGREVYGTIIK